MRSRAYIETSVISYLTAKPSQDLIKAARQLISSQLWRRDDYDFFVSTLVHEEAGQGDQAAARSRLDLIANVLSLPVTQEAADLASLLIQRKALPAIAYADALHIAIAIATIHEMDPIASWNFRHLASPFARAKIEEVLRDKDFEPPVIAPPDQPLESKR